MGEAIGGPVDTDSLREVTRALSAPSAASGRWRSCADDSRHAGVDLAPGRAWALLRARGPDAPDGRRDRERCRTSTPAAATALARCAPGACTTANARPRRPRMRDGSSRRAPTGCGARRRVAARREPGARPAAGAAGRRARRARLSADGADARGYVTGVPVLDRFSLDGKVAIVTGASSGLGVAFAKALAEAGADVALGARRVEKLEDTRELVEAAGRRAIVVRADVSDPDSCQELVDTTMKDLGRVDVLVNNAGVGTAVPASKETPDEFRQVLDINLNGCYWMAQRAAKVMEPGSSIVNISSVIGLTTGGLPQAAYSASKAGLIGLTRDLAQQWTGRKGIRVNALAPGWFESEMSDQLGEEHMQRQLQRIIAGRIGDPEELAAALVFLASDAGGYVTGQTLAVDGGFTIT